MRRFYSHYTFIHPDIYLRNVVVELDSNNVISDIFPFEKEIENTEFHSGWLYCIPQKGQTIDISKIDIEQQFQPVHQLSIEKIACHILNEEGLIIS